MIDLSTTYLGLRLRTPLVASASPLSQELDGIRRLEDAGAAVVLYSLFEEQLKQEASELEHHLSAGTESFAESLTYGSSQEFVATVEGTTDTAVTWKVTGKGCSGTACGTMMGEL